jgi:hypothetical protein
MDCRFIEDRLTEFLDRTLPAGEMQSVTEHVSGCPGCGSLLVEMREVVGACRAYPTLEPELRLIDRVLLRTSGRPRTRTLRELVRQYLVGPMLTPRFAMGAALSIVFVVFTAAWITPRVSGVAAALSPREMFRRVDRAAQQAYGEGLKLYDKKNEWQAQFQFFKTNVINRLGFMIEQLDGPAPRHDGSERPGQQQRKAPTEKSSILLLPA